MTYTTKVFQIPNAVVVNVGGQIIAYYRWRNGDGLPIVPLLTGNPSGVYTLPTPLSLLSPINMAGTYTAVKVNTVIEPIRRNQAMIQERLNVINRSLQEIGITRFS